MTLFLSNPLSGHVKRKLGNLLVYLLLLIVFLFAYDFDFLFFDDLMVLVLGFFGLILVPGENLVELVNRRISRGLAVVLGFLIILLFIQIQFYIALFLHIQIPLRYWLVSSCFIFHLIFTLMKREVDIIRIPRLWIDKCKAPENRNFIYIISVAIAVRLLVTPLGLESFAPDAGLYFDYARNVNQGLFESGIMNDGAVLARGTGIEEISHLMAGYMYAISSLLMSGSQVNPILVLFLFNILLLGGIYELSSFFFDNASAEITLGLISLHPTLVYFSVIGYGPEIFSLVFLIFGIILLLKNSENNKKQYALVGVLIAIAESIWYVNFYIVIFVLPLTMIFAERRLTLDVAIVILVAAGVFLARRFLFSIPLYILIWALVFLIPFLVKGRISKRILQAYPILLSIFVIQLVLYIPSQLSFILDIGRVSGIGFGAFSAALFNMPTLEYIIGGLFFFTWHVTPFFLIMCIMGLWFFRNNRNFITLSLATVAILIGTGIILISVEPMRIEYLYTTARFLISTLVLGSILVGALLQKGWIAYGSWTHGKFSEKKTKSPQIVGCLLICLLVIGSFGPGYLVLKSNADFVNPEKRYAWQELIGWVEENTHEDSRFLLDRAREFAWLADRQTIYLELFHTRNFEWNATNELLQMGQEFSADYLIIDGYTIAHWNNFEFLLRTSMENGNVLPLNATIASSLVGENTSEYMHSIELLHQTQANSYGDYVRVFSLVQERYSVSWRNVSFNDDWDVSSGIVLNETRSEIHFIESTNASIERRMQSPINIITNGGFVLLSFSEVDAQVIRIILIDSQGVVVQEAEQVERGLFYAQLGSHQIDNIRIEIQGNAQGIISLVEMAIWQ